MMQLRPESHAHLGWRPASSFGFARRVTLVPLAVAEIARVAQVLPVLFRKVDDRWQAVAVMGPIEGANVFVSREGKWRTSFVPALLRVYPFKLTEAGELALWEGYQPELLAADGVQPFYEAGMLASRLQQTLVFLKTLHSGIAAVQPVLELLEASGLLIRWEVPAIETPQPMSALQGLYILEEKRSEKQDTALVHELYSSGSLRWLYAHLDSFHHLHRFKALARAIVVPAMEAPRQPDKLDQVADILAAISEDLGDAEL